MTSRDTDGNVSGSVDRFDKDGNPVDPSAGGGPAGADRPDLAGAMVSPAVMASPEAVSRVAVSPAVEASPEAVSRVAVGPAVEASPEAVNRAAVSPAVEASLEAVSRAAVSPGAGDGDPPAPGGGDGGEIPVDDGSGGGSGDEGPSLGGRLGRHVMDGFQSLVLGDGDGGDGQGEGEGGEGPDFGETHRGLTRDVVRGGPPIDPEGGGWGQDDDGEGSEGPPTLHFSGDTGLLAALGHAPQPTEDWGDSTDPRALVALTASVLNVSGDRALQSAMDAVAR